MRLNRWKIGLVLLVSLISTSMISGCASFAGRELSVYTNEQLSAPEKRISASYDVKAFGLRGENVHFAAKLDKEIRKVLSGTQLFSELKSGADQRDYHYSFVMRNEGYPAEPLAFLNGFISGFTFTVIPAFARDIFILTVDVKEGDRVVKTYTYRDHIDSWIQLFLVFLMPTNRPTDVASAVLDNMIMNFAHDFSADVRSGILLAQQN